jgi:hypothetical protein
MKSKLLYACIGAVLFCGSVKADLYAVGSGSTRAEAYGNALARLPSAAVQRGTTFSSAGPSRTVGNGPNAKHVGNYICRIAFSINRK